ncbi:unnamed protein product [Ostreobium quekettii]|uniref:Uncharacterized protein n=1 Tax=Ostreobium quekettii TaxID=121088 RepID=A0A8S1J0X8_9CHLO|nr:unnamed protein product [Ostreobium quekettii]
MADVGSCQNLPPDLVAAGRCSLAWGFGIGPLWWQCWIDGVEQWEKIGFEGGLSGKQRRAIFLFPAPGEVEDAAYSSSPCSCELIWVGATDLMVQSSVCDM